MSMMDRIQAAGIVLPAAEMPKALYVPYTLHHGLLTVSGQLPLRNGKPVFVGTVPDAVAVDAAQEAARLCLANLLGWVARCGGRLRTCPRRGVMSEPLTRQSPTIRPVPVRCHADS